MRMAMRIAVNMSLPKDLVEELDDVAGPRNRSAFVEGAVRDRLRREQMHRAWRDAAGSLREEDYPHWSTSENVQEWVRLSRREQTDVGSE